MAGNARGDREQLYRPFQPAPDGNPALDAVVAPTHPADPHRRLVAYGPQRNDPHQHPDHPEQVDQVSRENDLVPGKGGEAGHRPHRSDGPDHRQRRELAPARSPRPDGDDHKESQGEETPADGMTAQILRCSVGGGGEIGILRQPDGIRCHRRRQRMEPELEAHRRLSSARIQDERQIARMPRDLLDERQYPTGQPHDQAHGEPSPPWRPMPIGQRDQRCNQGEDGSGDGIDEVTLRGHRREDDDQGPPTEPSARHHPCGGRGQRSGRRVRSGGSRPDR